nr:hypothetical protein [Tanacetum cinerariifolium]
MLHVDVVDSDNRIEPRSHKEHSKNVNDDEIEKEKKDDNKDDKKDDDVEKTNKVVEEKDNDDHTDHTLVGSHATVSMETRNEQMQIPIPTPNRSPKKDLSYDNTISEELMATVSPTTATTSKHSSKSKSKREFTSNKTKILPGSIAGMCSRYPTTRLSTAKMLTADLQHQLYLNMKSKPPDQAADPELWEIMKTKFEKPQVSTSSYQYELFTCHD